MSSDSVVNYYQQASCSLEYSQVIFVESKITLGSDGAVHPPTNLHFIVLQFFYASDKGIHKNGVIYWKLMT